MVKQPSHRGPNLMGAVDARDILPVADRHGGVTVYFRGRPAYYLLAGEWYEAVSRPAPTVEGLETTGRGRPALP